MTFGRRQPENLELANLNEIVQRSERMLQILAAEDIELDLDLYEGECLTQAESNQLEQILMNLVTNARDAMPRGGRIRVQTGVVDLDAESVQPYVGLQPNRYVKLSVADTGDGIPPEVLPHIFEPFFTTKEIGKGTGLGLSTVYGIVRQYKGHIGCQSSSLGTTITILLPVLENSPRANNVVADVTESEAGTETILLVEDEPALRRSVHKILEQNGYKVIAASNGREALDLDLSSARPDLLLTDISLPQMKGTELAERFSKRISGLKIMFMSGYAGDSSVEAAHFLPKPFRREVLIRKVREVLDS
jgi:CheY-like chemotaxis protein